LLSYARKQQQPHTIATTITSVTIYTTTTIIIAHCSRLQRPTPKESQLPSEIPCCTMAAPEEQLIAIDKTKSP
jgi:hypothetical protein